MVTPRPDRPDLVAAPGRSGGVGSPSDAASLLLGDQFVSELLKAAPGAMVSKDRLP